MPSDVFYDAINLFKYSSVGRGERTVSGSQPRRDRYIQLVEDSIDALWRCWSRDGIRFDNLPSGSWAKTENGQNIVVNSGLSPQTANYGSQANQSKLAAVSHAVAHEGAHLVTHRRLEWLVAEVMCRYVDQLYLHDVLNGMEYSSRVTGTRLRARLDNATSITSEFLDEQSDAAEHARQNQIIDFVLSYRIYREQLSARFVEMSFDWWGGMHNRKPITRGYYINALARARRTELIVDILESFAWSRDWQQAAAVINAPDVRELLRDFHDPMRLAAIECMIGERLLYRQTAIFPHCAPGVYPIR